MFPYFFGGVRTSTTLTLAAPLGCTDALAALFYALNTSTLFLESRQVQCAETSLAETQYIRHGQVCP